MMKVLIEIPKKVHKVIWTHLLPKPFTQEEAAFIFAQSQANNGDQSFQYIDWVPVPPEGFVSHSLYHLELTDEVRAGAIKRAHDLGASLIELHSHAGRRPAEFSISDLLGFEEFVPHVWWRLKGRPYLAVVVSRSGFDALAWLQDPKSPQQIDGLVVENSLLKPTGRSRLRYDLHDRFTF
jgi:hypothetical protein